jgi:hypothetical protein
MTGLARTILPILALALPGSARAQTGQWGQMNAPQWGQHGAPAWGQYSNQLGVPWQYNRTMAPPEPTGAILNPNQVSGNFSNPRTGSSLFVPEDTRFKGRDRP